MARDPYLVLGVSRTASADEIRRAYRKLAKENHPDLNPERKTASEEKLKVINAAFAIVGDEEKRRQYDAGQIDANGEPVQPFARTRARGAHARHGTAGDDPAFADIFADLFGRSGHGGFGGPGGHGFAGTSAMAKGSDVRYSLEIDFLEAALGTRRRVTLPDGVVLDLTVPEGIEDGRTLRLKGKGRPGISGAAAGDALVEIRVRPHPTFKRSGNEILSEVPITIDEAVIGGKVEVPTISGRVQLTIPKGTSSGRAFRLKGKGIKAAGGQAGDHIVTVSIVLPQEIDDKLAYFLSEWRLSHGYDPRKS